MDRLAKLCHDVALLWGKYHGMYLDGVKNTLILALIATAIGCAIGLVCGVAVVLGCEFIDKKLHIDDPVGALSVHLVCGVWGTLAVGIFSPDHELVPQIIGIVAVAVAAIASSGIIFYILKKTIGLRVEHSEELRGLDVGEHGMEAYHGFQIFSNE